MDFKIGPFIFLALTFPQVYSCEFKKLGYFCRNWKIPLIKFQKSWDKILISEFYNNFCCNFSWTAWSKNFIDPIMESRFKAPNTEHQALGPSSPNFSDSPNTLKYNSTLRWPLHLNKASFDVKCGVQHFGSLSVYSSW